MSICPQCGEPGEEGTMCMICGASIKKRFILPKKGILVAIFGVVVIIFAYLLFAVFFGPTIVTSTGNVQFEITLEDGVMSVEYEGTADGRSVKDLQIAILAEGGPSSQLSSFKYPQPGAVLGPVDVTTTGKPVSVYYAVFYADGTKTDNIIPI